MGGDLDYNVPLQNGEQMYEALRSLGIETQLVIYPGQHHGLTPAELSQRPAFTLPRMVRLASRRAGARLERGRHALIIADR